MTEQEWLTSTDPAAMLGFAARDGSLPGDGPNRRIIASDRKLRLWCVAMFDLSEYDYSSVSYPELSRWRKGEADEGEQGWPQAETCRLWCDPAYDNLGDPPMRLRAALLRDIVGNPWRAMLPSGGGPEHHILDERVCERCGKRTSSHPYHCPACGSEFIRKWRVRDEYPWLTPTVLALAQAAYEERGGSTCKECDHGQAPTYGPSRVLHCCGRPTQERRDSGNGRGGYWPRWCSVCWASWLPELTGYHTCPACHGTGTGHVSTSTLDPGRLGVLADALEDAGCDNEEILRHLRGPGPHVRGCWVVDLILGKE